VQSCLAKWRSFGLRVSLSLGGNSMMRSGGRSGSVTSILVVIVAVAGFAPTPGWAAAKPGALPAIASGASVTSQPAPSESDDDDQAAPLRVTTDFNRDGIADRAEVTLPTEDHSGVALLTVSLGKADGTFKQTASRPALGHDPRAIVSGDFNQDGIPDLIVGDDDGALLLLLGDGTGNMVPVGEVAHLSSAVSIVVADFNHDGILDVAVTDWRASAVSILLGAGKGSLRSAWSFPLRMAGTSPHLAVADFNGDGISDLVVVYDSDDEDTFDVMLGNGNGTFNEAPDLGLTRDPNAHCVT
jgi:hypothetical protein